MTLNELQRFRGTFVPQKKRLKRYCYPSPFCYNTPMSKTIIISMVAIAIFLTVAIGYGAGFKHSQKMWEQKIIEQIKKG